MKGELDQHLADVDEQVRRMVDELMEQMMRAEGVTEELKRQDWMEWVKKVNSIKERAKEIIMCELIYI